MNPSQTSAEPPTFHGVRVDHPSIVSSIRNLIKQGYDNGHICRVIGQPQEVVDKQRRILKEGK